MRRRDADDDEGDLGPTEDPDEADTDAGISQNRGSHGWSDDPQVVPCPECGEDVSEDAQRCPHCDEYISTDAPPPGQNWWIIATVAIVIAALVAGIFWGM